MTIYGEFGVVDGETKYRISGVARGKRRCKM
jgi:hypothetical protein